MLLWSRSTLLLLLGGWLSILLLRCGLMLLRRSFLAPLWSWLTLRHFLSLLRSGLTRLLLRNFRALLWSRPKLRHFLPMLLLLRSYLTLLILRSGLTLLLLRDCLALLLGRGLALKLLRRRLTLLRCGLIARL
jgi:hypothetical protein